VWLRFADSIARCVDKNGIASAAIVIVALGVVNTGCERSAGSNQTRDCAILGALSTRIGDARSRVAVLCTVATVSASDALGRVWGWSERLADSIAGRVDKNGVASTAIVIVTLGIVDTRCDRGAGSNQTRHTVILGALQTGERNAGSSVAELRSIATVGTSDALGSVWGWSRSRSGRLANSIACCVDKNGIASTAIVIVALGIVDTRCDRGAGSNETRDRVILGALQTGKSNAGSRVAVLCPIATIRTRGTVGRAGSRW
jgi:hypothetical protein